METEYHSICGGGGGLGGGGPEPCNVSEKGRGVDRAKEAEGSTPEKKAAQRNVARQRVGDSRSTTSREQAVAENRRKKEKSGTGERKPGFVGMQGRQDNEREKVDGRRRGGGETARNDVRDRGEGGSTPRWGRKR